jgi:hypothetical protein
MKYRGFTHITRERERERESSGTHIIPLSVASLPYGQRDSSRFFADLPPTVVKGGTASPHADDWWWYFEIRQFTESADSLKPD